MYRYIRIDKINISHRLLPKNWHFHAMLQLVCVLLKRKFNTITDCVCFFSLLIHVIVCDFISVSANLVIEMWNTELVESL